jgi:hypothetical protein
MNTWTYTINSIQSGDTCVWISIALSVNGTFYGNYDFPVDSSASSMDTADLQELLQPQIDAITAVTDPAYTASQQAIAAAQAMQDAATSLLTPNNS